MPPTVRLALMAAIVVVVLALSLVAGIVKGGEPSPLESSTGLTAPPSEFPQSDASVAATADRPYALDDLFGDLQEAVGTAAGGLIGLATLPVSILTRAQWASVGHYRFPIKDWRNGPAEWPGEREVFRQGARSPSTRTRGLTPPQSGRSAAGSACAGESIRGTLGAERNNHRGTPVGS